MYDLCWGDTCAGEIMGFSTFRPTGTVHFEPKRAFDGLTLYCLLNGKDVYLVDMDGSVRRHWPTPTPNWRIFSADLLESGNLLMLCITKDEFKLGGGGVLVE